jgi:hypothetical protein
VAKPALADRIARRILRVERAKYRTAECQRVAIGHAIDALSRFYAQIQRKGPVLKFVERQRRNSRPAVRKRAEEFMRRFQK